jgi:hypothetical protein
VTEPLIYTSLGNVPERELRQEVEWLEQGGVLIFHQRWIAADGSLVKNSIHGKVFHEVTVLRLLKKWARNVSTLVKRNKSAGLVGSSVKAEGAL